MHLFSQFWSLVNVFDFYSCRAFWKVITRTFIFTCVLQNTSHISSVRRRHGSNWFVIFIQDPFVWINTILVLKIKDGFLALSVVVQPIHIKHVKVWKEVAAVEPGGKPSASIIRPLKFRKLSLQAALRQAQKATQGWWQTLGGQFSSKGFHKTENNKKQNKTQCCWETNTTNLTRPKRSCEENVFSSKLTEMRFKQINTPTIWDVDLHL